MARRAVWLALILSAAPARPGRAMQSLSDPSAQGAVGMTPIPSLDRINGLPTMPGTTPASGHSPAVNPTAPTGSGTAATLPAAPGDGGPVGLSPLPPIQKSLDRGYRFGRLSDLFRKDKSQPAPAPRSRSAQSGPKANPETWSPNAIPRRSSHPDRAEPPTVAPPRERPSPYADRASDTPRRQLEGPSDPQANPAAIQGRPNPLADLPAPRARARMAADPGPSTGRPASSTTAEYRPQGVRPRAGQTVAEALATARAPEPAPIDPTPGQVVPPGPPPLESESSRATEGPIVMPAPEAVPIAMPTPEPVPEPPSILEAPAPAPEPVPTDPAPPVEPPSPSEPAPMPIPVPANVAVLAPTPGPTDPAITRTGAESAAVRMSIPAGKDAQFATLRAAAVGDEVITLHELMVAVNERIHDYIDPSQQVTPEELKAIKNQMAPVILKALIEQSLILQEAKRMMKGEKNLKAFNEYVAKLWRDEELPGLLRQYKVKSEADLKQKLAEQNRSYDGLREAFRKRKLSQDFIFREVRNKATADTIELRAYYNAHEHDFDRPSRMSWREVEISQARHPDREAARKAAQAIRERLAKGENFAAVAKASSEGPTASAGGLYADITPGGYGIAPVNEALGQLAVGELSGVIEAPSSFHIVRVEGRREAGPLHFDEVQEEIRNKVRMDNFDRAVKEYLGKLRARTLVRTMFDPPPPPRNAQLRADLKR